jgi:hypothetical protein
MLVLCKFYSTAATNTLTWCLLRPHFMYTKKYETFSPLKMDRSNLPSFRHNALTVIACFSAGAGCNHADCCPLHLDLENCTLTTPPAPGSYQFLAAFALALSALMPTASTSTLARESSLRP